MNRDGIRRAATAADKMRQRAREIRQETDLIVTRVRQLVRESAPIIQRHLDRLSVQPAAAPDLRCAAETVLDAVIGMQGADFGNMQLLDPRSRVLEIVAQRGFRPSFLQIFRCVSADDGSACGRALRTGEPVLIEDVNKDAGFEPYREIAAGAGFRAVQSIPLISTAGEFVGVVSTHFAWPYPVSATGMATMRLYARHAADVLARLAPSHHAS